VQRLKDFFSLDSLIYIGIILVAAIGTYWQVMANTRDIEALKTAQYGRENDLQEIKTDIAVIKNEIHNINKKLDE